MLTLKFYKSCDASTTTLVVSCQHYLSHQNFEDGPIMIVANDIEYRIGDGFHDLCYVENAAGKTIDKIRWASEKELNNG